MNTRTNTQAAPFPAREHALVAPATPGPLATLGALVGHFLRLQARAIVIWGLALGALTAMVVAVYPSIGDQLDEVVANYPPELQAFFGANATMGTVEGFLAMEVFNFMAPIALAFYAVILGARAIAGAEERGTLDVFLGNPLPRWHLVAAALVTLALALLGIVAILGGAAWIAAVLAGVDLPLSAVVAGTLNLVPLSLFFGGLALLCSALVHRGGLAIAIPGAVLLAMYMVNALSSLASALEPLRPLSAFHHYGSAIEHGLDWPRFAGLAVAAALLAALAAFAFERRDIYT